MKYIIRFIAAIPMLCIGLSALCLLAGAFEYSGWLFILSIVDFWVFIYFSHYYEEMVDGLCDFIRNLANKTPIYK